MKQFIVTVLIAVLFSISGPYLFKGSPKHSIGKCWYCHTSIYDDQSYNAKKIDYTIIQPGPFVRYLVLYTKYIILHEECCEKANMDKTDARSLLIVKS